MHLPLMNLLHQWITKLNLICSVLMTQFLNSFPKILVLNLHQLIWLQSRKGNIYFNNLWKDDEIKIIKLCVVIKWENGLKIKSWNWFMTDWMINCTIVDLFFHVEEWKQSFLQFVYCLKNDKNISIAWTKNYHHWNVSQINTLENHKILVWKKVVVSISVLNVISNEHKKKWTLFQKL